MATSMIFLLHLPFNFILTNYISSYVLASGGVKLTMLLSIQLVSLICWTKLKYFGYY